MNQQFLPYGNGMPTEESLTEYDEAEAKFKAAKAAVDRIVAEIRTGRR